MLRTVSLLLGTALLALMLWHLGLSNILALIRRISWYSIPILLLYVANHVVASARAVDLCAAAWHPYLRHRTGDPDRRRSHPVAHILNGESWPAPWRIGMTHAG